MVSRLKIIGPFGSDLRNKTYRPRKLDGWRIKHWSQFAWQISESNILIILYVPSTDSKKKSKTETKRNSTDFWSLIQQNAVAMESFEDVPLRNDLLPLTAQCFQAKPSISDGSGSPWCQVACPCPSSLLPPSNLLARGVANLLISSGNHLGVSEK